jgi:predicted aldo/keto reductase-like oxidoreductase
VPTRPFGKTGVNVSILSLGGELSASDLLVFRQAFKIGVTYWDTADSYGGGNNEKAIGKYFTKFPNDREKVFLVTKAATSDPKKLTENFMNKGYTAEQAKLKAVWENPNIASICSAMPNMTILQANVAAARNKINLSKGDKRRLEQYARQTSPGYCAGCAELCETAINNKLPISNVMRCLMYDCSYDDSEKARALFKKIPLEVQKGIANIDYRNAEQKCPQRIQIGRLMREAASKLV